MSVSPELDELLHDPGLISLEVQHASVVAKLLGENTTHEHRRPPLTMDDEMGRALATALKESVSIQSFQLSCGGAWGRDLPITDVLSRNRQLPVHWLAAACFARHAAPHASIGENDLRRAVFAFFLPEGAANRLAARNAARRAADGPAAKPTEEADGRRQRTQEAEGYQGDGYQGDAGDSTDTHEAIQATESVVMDSISTIVVMDSIEHADPPAMIDEQEASAIADVQHAGFIERNLGSSVEQSLPTMEAQHSAFAMDSLEHPEPASTIDGHEADVPDEGAAPAVPEKVHLLRFGTPPSGGDGFERFRERLLQGPELQPCRESLESAGHHVVSPEGALTFVKPEQYVDTRCALVGFELHPFHIIISESFEYLLEEVLSTIPYKRRPRIKAQPGRLGRVNIQIGQPSSSSQDVMPDGDGRPVQDMERLRDEDENEDEEGRPAVILDMVILDKRTFLGIYPALRDANSVVQSTTEAVAEQSEAHYSSSRGVNPRRHV
eukprot:gnl/TRDRNA2_/TRDRNA2_179575_c0_seq1.p1 gnl/TRDRNA2_/TRDRNA2_179575_c0~~gnl/TRDRNA2_/TRDRNA2_179575_c0_seq1.p1  ORF type:complete len:495 (+),score=90.08 gnl/TRDRNA2_/TRDRNA2_179575_c0_seq1:51-1535(+)